MRINALSLTVTTVVLGIFGAFLRWVQNVNAFEEGTGLATPGALSSAAFGLFTLAAFAAMAGLVMIGFRRRRPRGAAALFRVRGPMPAVGAWLLCVVMAVCGLILMFTAGSALFPILQRLLGAAAVVAGACFPMLPGRVFGGLNSLARPASVFLALFCGFWLICTYCVNALNPVLWSFGPETLAVAFTAMAFYFLAGCYYERKTCRAALIVGQMAIYLDLAVLSDGLSFPQKGMLAAAAAMLLMLEYIMLSNFRERGEE